MQSRINLLLPAFIGILLAITNTSIAQLQSPLDIALRHLEQNQEKLQLTKADLANYFVSDLYKSKHNGVTHVYLNQQHQNIALRKAIINVNILSNGKVLNMGNRFTPDLQSRANSSTPSIAPEVALRNVINHFQIQTSAPLEVKERINEQHFIFENAGIALEPIRVKLVYELLDNKSIRLAWNVKLYQLDAKNWWDASIDAQTGEVLVVYDQVIHCDFNKGEQCDNELHQHTSKATHSNSKNTPDNANKAASIAAANSYNVYPLPVESPNHGDRELLSDPANTAASPFGWHDTDGVSGAEFTITRGNNAHAYQDIFNNNNSIGDEPDGGNSLDFDFPLDLSPSQPYTQVHPAVVNLFYWNNVMHDLWYQYGFDEASGNFQENNYGNGGLGTDYVRAEALDGSGTNNANMGTPEDGERPRMQMYVWTNESLPPTDNFNPTMIVSAPDSLIGEYEIIAAAFGAAIPDPPIVSEVVLVTDTTGTVTDACEPIVNGAEINGKIAMIDRGDCQFGSKVLNAENNGAIAVIICNNNTDPIFAMGPGMEGGNVTIPSVMISLQDCNTLKMGLPGLTVTFEQPQYEIPMPGPTAIDGDFDNGIIIHEYTHGISIRLTGGPSTNCLNGFEQAGEGWSDWFALAMLTTSSSTAEQKRGMGTYALEEPVDGIGIRDFPYSRDMGIDPHTYADINSVSVPHGVGSVWAVTIWDLYWNMIDVYGFDEDFYNGTGGNNMTMQLVLDGLKLQPCSPTFLDSRDAILAADEANYDGVNQCLIWETFARRGIGYSALAGGVEAFDLPDLCNQVLKINKIGPSEAFAGDIIEYTLEITNDFPELLSNTTISDTIPSGTTYVAGSSTCPNTTVDAGIITIEVGNVAVGEMITCTYQLQVDEDPFSYLVFEDDIENGEDSWEVISDVGTVEWTLNPNSYEGDFAWFAENTATPCDQYLIVAQPNNLEGSNPALSFWHRYATEAGWDGGVVEISTDEGLTWEDLGDHIVQNGYNGTLNDNLENPISGQPAFNGNSGVYIETIIDLSSFSQQDMLFRFRLGCDGAVGADGWYIDNISLYGDLYTITNIACVNSGLNENKCSEVTTTVFGEITDTKTVTESGLEASIFPNPTNNKVIVQLSNKTNSSATISLLNINGQVLDSKKMEYANGSLEMSLNDYPEGIYMIQIQTDQTQLIQKVVKQ